jgi:hypothetical protein
MREAMLPVKPVEKPTGQGFHAEWHEGEDCTARHTDANIKEISLALTYDDYRKTGSQEQHDQKPRCPGYRNLFTSSHRNLLMVL